MEATGATGQVQVRGFFFVAALAGRRGPFVRRLSLLFCKQACALMGQNR